MAYGLLCCPLDKNGRSDYCAGPKSFDPSLRTFPCVVRPNADFHNRTILVNSSAQLAAVRAAYWGHAATFNPDRFAPTSMASKVSHPHPHASRLTLTLTLTLTSAHLSP